MAETENNELLKWQDLMASGQVLYVRPRKWCGRWILWAYGRRADSPTGRWLLSSIVDSPEAFAIVRDHKVSVEDVRE